MKIYTKEWSTVIPASIEDVWAFFSTPSNLNELTPPEMNFDVLSDVEDVKIYEGMIIQYRITPFWFYHPRWVTEITHLKEKAYFIDEQRYGPYAMWHHEHHFKTHQQGVLMTDILHYGLPFGFLGRMVNRIAISREIDRIFDFRGTAIKNIFSNKNSYVDAS